MTPARTSSVSTRSRVGASMAALTIVAGLLFAACGPAVDEEFPPGDPTMAEPGDNPVLGSDGPGAALSAGGADTTNYGLLALLALCLIAAGVLLVKVEAWERRRAAERDAG